MLLGFLPLLILVYLPNTSAFSSIVVSHQVSRRLVLSPPRQHVSLKSTAEDEINQAEARLKQAMLDSDVEVLDDVLDDKLVFTNHLGVTMGKQDDLEAHKQKMVRIVDVQLSDLQILVLDPGTTGVVTVAAHIVGTFLGDPFEDTLRFTRVWHQVATSQWKLIAAHSSLQQHD